MKCLDKLSISWRAMAAVIAFYLPLSACVAQDIDIDSTLNAGSVSGHIPYVANPDFKIDGRIDEAAWADALVVDLGIETRPGENIPAPVQTSVLLVDTGSALVVAFRAEDPAPADIRAYYHDRDAAFSDDFVGVVLDTFNDGRRALEFFANPLGVQMDLIMDDVNGNEDSSWDAIWDSAGLITEVGFDVEMEIPYSALQLPSGVGLKTWGIDLLRFYPRDQRYRLSNNPQDRDVSCYLCQLDKFEGFDQAIPGRDLEITPTLTVRASEVRDNITDDDFQDVETDIEPGLDVSWGVTPNVTLNATLNPDFSQVEADVAQLNVNQTFALFFPEKRPFFLEGADFFSTPNQVVFTRNVTDPDYGARVTGKVGRNAFGVFIAEDTQTNILIPGALGSDFASLDESSLNFVGRYRRDVGENSSVGLIATGRDAGDYSNSVIGVDGRWRFSESDTLTWQYLTTDTDNPANLVEDFNLAASQSGDGMTVSYDHSERDWYAYASHSDFDEGFRADSGFISRVDYEQQVVGGGRIWHGEADKNWYTNLRLNGDWDITHDQSGRVLEREVEAYFSFNGPMQSFLQLGGGIRDRFWDGVLFDEEFYQVYAEMQPIGGLYLELFTRGGTQIDFSNTKLGDFTQFDPQIRWNIGKHLQARVRHNYRQLSRDGGDVFTANQTDFRLAYQFDLRQRLRLTVQYTDVERDVELYNDPVDASFRQLGTQLIYSYKVNPRTVLFAGYSDTGFETDEVVDLTRTDRTLFMKVGYAWEPNF